MFKNIIKTTNIKEIKNLNIELVKDGLIFKSEFDVFGKSVNFKSNVKILETPNSLASGSLRFVFGGDESLKKILEGLFLIVTEVTNSISSNDDEITINFNNLKLDESIKGTLKNLKFYEFKLDNKNLNLNILYD
ncbi:hypothetical protein [Tepiditoga spiralis]|uniref:hypothetical protein n=1 Tax=Tepiditoga spiralis TaxID=2108365 RepID=UPI001689E7A2|nr:hypothetical protein [Tepiditoga spiralis]